MSLPSVEGLGATDSSTPNVKRNSARAEFFLVRVPMHLLAIVMLVGVVLNFANVVARYFFQAPMFWAEEVLVYLMITAVFFALPAITFKNEHLRMDLVYLAFGAKLRRAADGLCVVLFLVSGIFTVYQSVKVVQVLAKAGQASVTAQIPMAVVHAVLPIGFLFMVVALVVRMMQRPNPDAASKVPG